MTEEQVSADFFEKLGRAATCNKERKWNNWRRGEEPGLWARSNVHVNETGGTVIMAIALMLLFVRYCRLAKRHIQGLLSLLRFFLPTFARDIWPATVKEFDKFVNLYQMADEEVVELCKNCQEQYASENIESSAHTVCSHQGKKCRFVIYDIKKALALKFKDISFLRLLFNGLSSIRDRSANARNRLTDIWDGRVHLKLRKKGSSWPTVASPVLHSRCRWRGSLEGRI